jgi:hypothetical protein
MLSEKISAWGPPSYFQIFFNLGHWADSSSYSMDDKDSAVTWVITQQEWIHLYQRSKYETHHQRGNNKRSMRYDNIMVPCTITGWLGLKLNRDTFHRVLPWLTTKVITIRGKMDIITNDDLMAMFKSNVQNYNHLVQLNPCLACPSPTITCSWS